jgi:hypothetical protein
VIGLPLARASLFVCLSLNLHAVDLASRCCKHIHTCTGLDMLSECVQRTRAKASTSCKDQEASDHLQDMRMDTNEHTKAKAVVDSEYNPEDKVLEAKAHARRQAMQKLLGTSDEDEAAVPPPPCACSSHRAKPGPRQKERPVQRSEGNDMGDDEPRGDDDCVAISYAQSPAATGTDSTGVRKRSSDDALPPFAPCQEVAGATKRCKRCALLPAACFPSIFRFKLSESRRRSL